MESNIHYPFYFVFIFEDQPLIGLLPQYTVIAPFFQLLNNIGFILNRRLTLTSHTFSLQTALDSYSEIISLNQVIDVGAIILIQRN